MMDKHPFSIWTLGGIPGGYTGTPAPADLESWGRTWQQDVSDEYLIGIAARAFGQNAETANMAAFIESQRRLKIAVKEFNDQSKRQIDGLIALAEASGKQNTTMIHLTQWLAALTIILGVIAGLQLWAMLKDL